MASWEQIERDIRRRKAKIRLFLRYAHQAGVRPFYGQARKDPRRLLLVSPDLGKRGSWRVTWFVDEEPYGHTVLRSFDAAVQEAVNEFGLDLDTVRFQADRDPRRSRLSDLDSRRARPQVRAARKRGRTWSSRRRS